MFAQLLLLTQAPVEADRDDTGFQSSIADPEGTLRRPQLAQGDATWLVAESPTCGPLQA